MINRGETTLTPESSLIERLQTFLDRVRLPEELRPAALEALHHYTVELPYHNVDHMFYVAQTTFEYCQERDITSLAMYTLILAALWHDADYHLPLNDQYSSKEHRSAALATEAILNLPSSNEDESEVLTLVANRSALLIISTHAEHTPLDIYEQTLNDADLSNLSGSSIGVVRNSIALWLEGRMLTGKAVVGDLEDSITSAVEEVTTYCTDTQTFLAELITKKQAASSVIITALKNIPKITFENMLRVAKGDSLEDNTDD